MRESIQPMVTLSSDGNGMRATLHPDGKYSIKGDRFKAYLHGKLRLEGGEISSPNYSGPISRLIEEALERGEAARVDWTDFDLRRPFTAPDCLANGLVVKISPEMHASQNTTIRKARGC